MPACARTAVSTCRRRRPALPGLASERIVDGGITAIDAVRALVARGFELEAERVLEMIRQRVLGDVLQTSAILDEDLQRAVVADRPERLRRAGHGVPHVTEASQRGGQRPTGVAPD